MTLEEQIEELSYDIKTMGKHTTLDYSKCKRVLRWLKELNRRRKDDPFRNVNLSEFRVDAPGFNSRKDFEGE